MANKNSYFSKFPIITYANTTAIDISKRSAVLNSVYNNPYNFYTYSLKDTVRPDTLAQQYYGDQFYSWLIYLGNKTIDPYYEWYMDSDTFNRFIISKYGSIEKPSQYVKYYRVNWKSNQETIDPAYYALLPSSDKKYWTVKLNEAFNVLSYTRNDLNWTVNTNYIIKFTFINVKKSFIEGENLKFYYRGNYIGKATYSNGNVCNIDFTDNIINLNNQLNSLINVVENEDSFSYNYMTSIYGESNPIPAYTCVGYESGASADITQYTILSKNIPIDEYTYWEPVTYYQYELEKNESNQNIVLLNSAYKDAANKNLMDNNK